MAAWTASAIPAAFFGLSVARPATSTAMGTPMSSSARPPMRTTNRQRRGLRLPRERRGSEGCRGPGWSKATAVLPLLGRSVDTAGDVNSDGYADVIVGVFGYDSSGHNGEGHALVYHGSADGVGAIPGLDQQSNQGRGLLWRASVGTAGDVNGDGYADVIVGAYSPGATATIPQAASTPTATHTRTTATVVPANLLPLISPSWAMPTRATGSD